MGTRGCELTASAPEDPSYLIAALKGGSGVGVLLGFAVLAASVVTNEQLSPACGSQEGPPPTQTRASDQPHGRRRGRARKSLT
jgi:hypothetical protein